MWFVYILKCKNGNFYTGVTNNLEKRIRDHNSGKGAIFTKKNKPCYLMWSEKCLDRSIAQKKEYKIKQLSHENKLKIINGSHK